MRNSYGGGVRGTASTPTAVARYSSTMPLALGTRLGPYEIFASLGAGGEVYQAPDTRR